MEQESEAFKFFLNCFMKAKAKNYNSQVIQVDPARTLSRTGKVYWPVSSGH